MIERQEQQGLSQKELLLRAKIHPDFEDLKKERRDAPLRFSPETYKLPLKDPPTGLNGKPKEFYNGNTFIDDGSIFGPSENGAPQLGIIGRLESSHTASDSTIVMGKIVKGEIVDLQPIILPYDENFYGHGEEDPALVTIDGIKYLSWVEVTYNAPDVAGGEPKFNSYRHIQAPLLADGRLGEKVKRNSLEEKIPDPPSLRVGKVISSSPYNWKNEQTDGEKAYLRSRTELDDRTHTVQSAIKQLAIKELSDISPENAATAETLVETKGKMHTGLGPFFRGKMELDGKRDRIMFTQIASYEAKLAELGLTAKIESSDDSLLHNKGGEDLNNPIDLKKQIIEVEQGLEGANDGAMSLGENKSSDMAHQFTQKEIDALKDYRTYTIGAAMLGDDRMKDIEMILEPKDFGDNLSTKRIDLNVVYPKGAHLVMRPDGKIDLLLFVGINDCIEGVAKYTEENSKGLHALISKIDMNDAFNKQFIMPYELAQEALPQLYPEETQLHEPNVPIQEVFETRTPNGLRRIKRTVHMNIQSTTGDWSGTYTSSEEITYIN